MATVQTLMAGGPISRGWMYSPWIDALIEAIRQTDFSLEVIHIVPSHDNSLQQEILSHCASRGIPVTILESKEPQRDPLHRNWGWERYELMANLRQMVLDEVAQREPYRFLSLDSDLLLHPQAIKNAMEYSGPMDIVGFKTYMSPPPDRQFPSYGMLKGESLWNRLDAEVGCLDVDVVMAAILAGPSAYSIPHGPHNAGEDIFWSKAATSAGLRLRWNTQSLCKHVMEPQYLDFVDPRLNF